MARVRVSATVDGERLAAARRLTGARDSALLDEALAALLRSRLDAQERAAITALPYEDDPELAWEVPQAPGLPYDGDVPDEVMALAAARRRR